MLVATEFLLPDIGEGVVEAEITKWLVQPGDAICLDQPFVEIMTDKVNVEIPSPVAGLVIELLAGEGEVVAVGNPIIRFGEPDEGIRTSDTLQVAKGVAPEPRPSAEDMADTERKVLATPAVRKLAKERGIDLTSVDGSGPQCRITREDVLRSAARTASGESGAADAGIVPEPARPEKRIPFRGVRKFVAEKMSQAIAHAAHATYGDEVDVTELVAVRAIAKERAAKEGIRLTYMPFVVKSVVRALKEHPYLNASVDDDASEIVLKKYYNIGIATNTPTGLMVPVVLDADTKSIFEVAREIQELAARAREGTLELECVRHGTFTITNVGSVGGIFSTPILNYPEVAILAIHKIVKRLVIVNNHTTPRDMMNIALAFDHRVIDGAEAGTFANRVKQYLEHPGLLLLDSD